VSYIDRRKSCPVSEAKHGEVLTLILSVQYTVDAGYGSRAANRVICIDKFGTEIELLYFFNYSSAGARAAWQAVKAQMPIGSTKVVSGKVCTMLLLLTVSCHCLQICMPVLRSSGFRQCLHHCLLTDSNLMQRHTCTIYMIIPYALCIQITLGKYSGKPEMSQPDLVRPVEDLSKVLVLEPQYRLTKGLTAKKLNFAIAGAIDEIEGAFAALTDTKQTHLHKLDDTDNDRVAWIYDNSIDIPISVGNAERSTSSNRDVTLAHIAHDIAADAATVDNSSNSNSKGSGKWPGECQFDKLQLAVGRCCST
jgi:hypothetical protein